MNYKTTIKADGSVSVFNIISQSREVLAADAVSAELNATLSESERAAIAALRAGAIPAQSRAILRGHGRVHATHAVCYREESAFTRCVASGDACNPAAHGGVAWLEHCSCGATREVNTNGRHEERGEWEAC